MNFVFIVWGAFPSGGAYFNMLISYALGLSDLGHKVKFLLLSLSKQKENTIIKDISIRYRSKFSVECIASRDDKQCNSHFDLLVNRHNSIKNLKKNIKENHKIYDVALVYGKAFPFTQLIGKICRENDLWAINQQTEYPFVGLGRKLHKYLYAVYFYKTIHKYFDALLVISNSLKRYYDRVTKQRIPIKVITLVIDFDLFSKPRARAGNNGDYIAYAGSITKTKDGVGILVDAFSIVLKKYPNLKLLIIGDDTGSYALELKKVVAKKRISEQVVFTGKVAREDVPILIENALLLCLIRPKSIQAKYGFPTKIGEYLATGKPVLTTNVGDLPCYVQSGKHLYFVPSLTPKNVSDKIIDILDHYQESKNVGIMGQQLAYELFNNNTQMKQLVNFISKTRKVVS